MQRREAGVGPAALELHEQGFFGRAGEVARTFEGAVGAARTLFLLEEKIRRMLLVNTNGQIIKKKNVNAALCFKETLCTNVSASLWTCSKIFVYVTLPSNQQGLQDIEQFTSEEMWLWSILHFGFHT